MQFPLIDGRDASGRRSSERGEPADVYLARQDGAPLKIVWSALHANFKALPLLLQALAETSRDADSE